MTVAAGVDVGKANLDVSIAEGPVIRFDNTAKGITKLLKHLRSRSRGVGARIIRRRRSLTPIYHCSSAWSISLTPIVSPSQLPCPANPTPSPIYPVHLRISPWLWFRSPFSLASCGLLSLTFLIPQ